jgi:hypothetical protein
MARIGASDDDTAAGMTGGTDDEQQDTTETTETTDTADRTKSYEDKQSDITNDEPTPTTDDTTTDTTEDSPDTADRTGSYEDKQSDITDDRSTSTSDDTTTDTTQDGPDTADRTGSYEDKQSDITGDEPTSTTDDSTADTTKTTDADPSQRTSTSTPLSGGTQTDTATSPSETARKGTGLEAVASGYVVGGKVVSKAKAKKKAVEQAVSNSELTREDVTARLQDGEVVYYLTEAGAERFKGEAGDKVGEGQIPTTQEAAEQLEQKVMDETAADSPLDVQVVEKDGELTAEYSPQGQEKAVAEKLGVEADDIRLEDDGNVVPTSERGRKAVTMQAIAEQFREKYPERQRLSVSQTGIGSWQAEIVTEDGETITRTIQTEGTDVHQRFRATGPLNQETAATIEKDIAGTKAERKLEAKTGVDLDSGDYDVTYETTEEGVTMNVSLTESGKRKVRTSPGAEEYGNVEFVIPGTGGETAEDYLHWASEEYSDALEDATGEGGIIGESAVAEGLEAAGYEKLAGGIESGGRDLLRGAGQMGNAPAMVLGIKEGAETLGYIGGKYVAGQGDEAMSQLEGDIAGLKRAVEQEWREDKAGVTLTAAGSLVGSVAVMGGAARISSRAGAAARWTIQPGEEALTWGGTKALSRTARGQKVLDAIPGGKLDWEEPVVYAGQKATRKVGAKARTVTDDLARRIHIEKKAAEFKIAEMRSADVETRFFKQTQSRVEGAKTEVEKLVAEERGQADLTGLQRPRSEFETEQAQRSEATELDRQATRPEARTDQESKLGSEAQKSEIRTEYESTQAQLAVREREMQEAQERLNQAFEQQARIDEGSQIDQRSRQEVGQVFETDTRVDQEIAVDQEVDQRVDQRLEQEMEFELEQELALETETESEIEVESESLMPDEPPQPDAPSTEIDEDFYSWEVPFASASEAVFGPSEMPDLDDLDKGGP